LRRIRLARSGRLLLLLLLVLFLRIRIDLILRRLGPGFGWNSSGDQ